MTVEDLKNELYGKTFPECEQWKRYIEKCPAYVRLVKFYEVVNKV